MTYSLLMHKNYDRYVTDAGYTAVAVFNIRSKVASELNNLKEQGDSIPDSIENYLERVFHLTQNIDSAWSENLSLQDGILTGANSDREADLWEALRSTSVYDRVAIVSPTDFQARPCTNSAYRVLNLGFPGVQACRGSVLA
jgi:hypothetical protein